MRFCRRYEVALRRNTHTAQTDPKQSAPAVTKFHSKLLRFRRRGFSQTKDIANIDQTPLLLVLYDRKTCADKEGAVKYGAYQDHLVLISGSAVCNWQYLGMVYPDFIRWLYFVEKAWELLGKSKKVRTAECRLNFNQKLGATNQWWKNGYQNNGKISL